MGRFRLGKWLIAYAGGTKSAAFSCGSLLPLLLIYEAGVRLSAQDGPSLRNAIDVAIRHAVPGLTIEVAPLLALALIVVGVRGWQRRIGRFRSWWAAVFLAEAAVWAIATLAVMRLVRFLEPASMVSRVGRVFAASAGAGAFEELVFRWGMAGGIRWILDRAGGPPLLAWTLALWTSSFAFAAGHVLGGVGPGLYADSFFRLTVLGLLLGVAFYVRGLAVAAYAHFFYDLFVALI